jgi:hypothetical protein
MDHRPLALPLSTLVETSFQLFTPDEVRRVSVCNVTNLEALDRSKIPIKGGLYDPAMGPLDPLRQAPATLLQSRWRIFVASTFPHPAPLPATSAAAPPVV